MLIPPNLLQGKNILLGVSGSIAVYKSLELVRLFTKAGANVKVIMSQSSQKFVTKLSFETLTSNEVLDDTNESWVNEHNHIKIGEWADIFLIAPCTANTMAKLAHGIADNILLQTALAYPHLKLLAPSANTNMIINPISQSNIKSLQAANYELIETQTKELACKTVGDGAMAEPIDIFWKTSKELLKSSFWDNKKAVVTSGGTIEKIDDVRYLSNFSSGKMASALATALYCVGANVTLIASRYEENIPQSIKLKKVQSSEQMLAETSSSLKDTSSKPYLFMAAAVSDYTPNEVQSGKLKKETLGESFSLNLSKNTDILASLTQDNIISIGFKAEMDKTKALNNATKMLEKKNLDAVCLNILEDSGSFGTDTNAIEFITKGKTTSLPNADKLTLALQILTQAEAL